MEAVILEIRHLHTYFFNRAHYCAMSLSLLRKAFLYEPPKFEYYAPAALPEALELHQYGQETKRLADAQSLMPLLSMRLARPEVIVDINHIRSLSYNHTPKSRADRG